MVQMSIYITRQQHTLLRAIALSEGESMATMVRRAIREFLRSDSSTLSFMAQEVKSTEAGDHNRTEAEKS